MSDKTLGKARGLNSIADPADFRGAAGRRKRGESNDQQEVTPPRPADEVPPIATTSGPKTASDTPTTKPTSNQRKRRELSVPFEISSALEGTSINPADIVMSAYRRHGDAIYAGAGGRPVSRGRARLRLSLTDSDFDKIIRLGDVRGWNRSETVAVLVAFELMPATMDVTG